VSRGVRLHPDKALGRLVAGVQPLRLLLFHGSRARGDAHAVGLGLRLLADAGFDPGDLTARLAEHLHADRIDLVDLDRAGALLRFRAARDGFVVAERAPGEFERFWLAAVDTWCDLAPVLKPAYRRPGRGLPVSPLDEAVLAERAAALERHLTRVGERLPASDADFRGSTDAADAVILHLWQATQIVIDLAVSACVARAIGTPQTYADAFRRLERAGVIERELADRLVRAAGFCNVVAHAFETLDMARVHRAASTGPADLARS
jgi:uncharacterized protein YutE (UPF0331/DUF86 family)